MTIWGVLLILLGIAAALVVICAVTVRCQKRHPNRQFDERQIAARGKANEFALLTGVLYYLFAGIYLTWSDANASLLHADKLVFIGIFVIWLTLHVYCFFSEAVFPLGQKPRTMVICYMLCAVMQISVIVNHIVLFGTKIDNEHGDIVYQLVAALTWLAIVVLHLLAYLRDKRASDEQ